MVLSAFVGVRTGSCAFSARRSDPDEAQRKKNKALVAAAVEEIGWEFAFSCFDDRVEHYERKSTHGKGSMQFSPPEPPPPSVWAEFNNTNFTKVWTYAGLGWVCEW